MESLVQVKGKWGQHPHPHRVRVMMFIKKMAGVSGTKGEGSQGRG